MKGQIFLIRFCLFWCLLALARQSNGQTNINMPLNNGPVSYTLNPPATCYFNFFDDGGPSGSYTPGSGGSSVVTFNPSAPGNKVVVTFLTFGTEQGFDGLFVYDGTSTAATQISSGQPALVGFPNPFSLGVGAFSGATAPNNVAPNVVRASASNISGALTFAFDSDISVGNPGWTAIVSEVPGDVCAITAPPDLTVNAPGNSCATAVSTPIPDFSPGGCQNSLQLQYRLNGGANTIVPAPLPTSVNLGNVPLGLNQVIWQLVNPCGGGLAAQIVQTIQVNDITPPQMTCPGDITVNLNPGECKAQVNFSVSCTDNCNFKPLGQVNHPIDFNTSAAGVMFDVTNLSSEPIVITEFDPIIDLGVWGIEIYYTSAAASWQSNENNPAAWTLVNAQLAVSFGSNTATPLQGFSITLAPGQSRGIYITSVNGAPLRLTGNNNGGILRTYDDGVLQVSSAPGAGKSYPFANTVVSRAYNGAVKYATVQGTPELVSGIPAGGEFPVGVTTNIYRCTDQSGNSATCAFTVSVFSFANPANTLVCNDFVNVALGPECYVALNGDQILEGGPYRCYDLYHVQIDKVPPYNNGPWVPGILTAADIGKTYGVKVTDPVTGNFCLSNIAVVDNHAPTLICNDVDLPCNINTSATYQDNITLSQSFLPTTGLPVNVGDYQTKEIIIPVSGPDDAVINDVDFKTLVTGDVFQSNFVIELESPAGTIVTLWNQLSGCTGNLSVRFDDEGSSNANCIDFTTGTRAQVPFYPAALSAFDGQGVKGNWKVRFRDINGTADLSTVTACELILNFSGTFSAGLPNGLLPGQITQTGPQSFTVPAPLMDGCSNVTLNYTDQWIAQPCGSGLTTIILRSWTARDASGNTATCEQKLRMLRPNLEVITFPPNYDNLDEAAFGCGTPYPTPNWIEAQGTQGSPYCFGLPFGCSINWTYEDLKISICNGAYTINRVWSAVDFCTSQTASYNQIIRVMDTEPPVFNCPANLTASTDLYQCCATVNLPDIIVRDDCGTVALPQAVVVIFDQYSGDTVQVRQFDGSFSSFPGNNPSDSDTLAVFGNSNCLPIGEHHVYYRVVDGCGNQQECSFTVTIRDFTAPVAVCDETTIVSIGADDPFDCYEADPNGCAFGGVTVVDAKTFDDGSYDNCGFIKLSVRRAEPYSDCIKSLNKQNGTTPCHDGYPDGLSEYGRATQEGDSIKFYCCEVGSTVDVILRAYQLDALGNLALGPDGTPLYNECTIKAEIQEKLKPGCQAPPNLTISCENFDPSLWALGLPLVEDNCCLDTSRVYLGQKGLTHSASYNQFDTLCNKGTLNRTFRVYDCHGQTATCTQRVVVQYKQDYYVRFPDDVLITFCDSSGVYGAPSFFGEDCEALGVSYTDEVFTVVPDACYKIERVWRIINWCTYDPNGVCIEVPNPNPNATLNHPSNLPGPTVSAPNAAAPWNPTVVKIKSTDQNPTNYSFYWNANANCYSYKQIIKIIDSEDPIAVNCPATPIEFCDVSDNDANLWNEIYWFDAVHNQHDLCEGSADLSIEAQDACSKTDVNIHYLLFLDLDGDGSMETVVNSNNQQVPNQVLYGNATNPNYTGGQPRAFDQRPVPNDQKYRFTIQTVVNGNKRVAYVRWNNQAQPASYTVPQLPYGNHKIKWIIEDGCGNETVCEYGFTIKDCKAPTVVCLNGLSGNIMATGMLPIYVKDFLQYASDNCTPSNQIEFAIRRSGIGNSFPVNQQGVPLDSLVFNCIEAGVQAIELWAIDRAGNASFCETYFLVQDPNDNCNPNQKASVAGALTTENADGIQDAHIEIDGSHPAAPPISLFAMSDPDGKFMFSKAIPMFGNYSVTPTKDDNPVNGVSTFDLVLISRHILGLQLLDSPYKMLAADANKNGTITSFDIVELRKLILGLYTELPNNTSWRFIDANYQFPNTNNPFWEAVPEAKSVVSIAKNQLADDFIAIKVGDVNYSAVTNNFSQIDDRSEGILYLDIESDREVKAGDWVEVGFTPAEVNQGYQFTLNFRGAQPEVSGITEDHYAIFDDAITFSLDGHAANNPFLLRFKAVENGKLSSMLGVSGRITRAEAYLQNEKGTSQKAEIALRFGGNMVSGLEFELYQNQPNPFVDRTSIAFFLPEDTETTLEIHDELGRLAYTQKAFYHKGYHLVPVDLSGDQSSGTLYYTIRTSGQALTRPMIRIQN